MSDSWLQWISAGVIGWVAWELRQLRHDVAHRVHYHDCDRRMQECDRRLNKLENPEMRRS